MPSGGLDELVAPTYRCRLLPRDFEEISFYGDMYN